jgi:hypothetical protein
MPIWASGPSGPTGYINRGPAQSSKPEACLFPPRGFKGDGIHLKVFGRNGAPVRQVFTPKTPPPEFHSLRTHTESGEAAEGLGLNLTSGQGIFPVP